MFRDSPLLGVSPLLPYIVALMAAPVIIILLWLAFRLASTPHQRLANLLSGGIGAVAASVSLILGYGPPPNSWVEDLFALVVVAAMITGAALGVVLSTSCCMFLRATTSSK